MSCSMCASALVVTGALWKVYAAQRASKILASGVGHVSRVAVYPKKQGYPGHPNAVSCPSWE